MDFLFDEPPRRRAAGWNKASPFTCMVCGQPGMGPPNTRVHQGNCRKVRQHQINVKSEEKRRQRGLPAK